MNKQIEAIRNEIKRLEEIHERNLKKPMERGRIGYAHGVVACCDRILAFIDSLPEEPAPKGYDESYLNECIAKASKTWKGVDVEKYMDEVRGDRPKSSDTLEEAAERQINEALFKWSYDDEDGIEQYVHDSFIAGAQWQKSQMMNDGNVILAEEDFDAEKEKSMELGYNLCKEQMMKEAVECVVVDFSSYLPRPQVDIRLDPSKYHSGDKVRVIIVKEDER